VVADLIIIPGGGLLADSSLPPWTVARLEAALAIRTTEPILTLSAGSPHKPGNTISEAKAATAYLLGKGVAPTDLLEENLSLDTIGNALFARLLHTSPRGYRRLHVITSEFHLPRTQACFDWIFSAEGPDAGYVLTYQASPDVGLAPAAVAARQAKERAAIDLRAPERARLRTLAAIHEWLFTHHEAYAVGLRPTPVTDPLLLASY
jgi:uncharacterized SAM-binding protein YcdF (DUF218 family)